MPGRVRIGISGWRYPPWRGVFYPELLAQRRELEYASRWLNTIEINGSFYSLQSPESYRQWHEQTPRGFQFAVKGSRFITHMLKLRNAETAAGELLRVRRAAAEGEARADPLAVPAELPLRCRAIRVVLSRSAPPHRGCREAVARS